jgi:putative restriction endonuclease
VEPSRDQLIRIAAFHYLDRLRATHGEVFAWRDLQKGFEFDGTRIPLIGAAGIWKPQALTEPISITTSHRDPYGDELGPDGFLSYRYQGSEARAYDNEGLRRAMNLGLPLVYFEGVARGSYAAYWPVVIVADDPATKTFTVACEDVDLMQPGLAPTIVDDVRRRYVTRLAMQRLHQAKFRQQVLIAYRRSCSVCHLRHEELLDAAHIVGDRHERGDPVVPNGLALCKIHHAAFDANILGVRPDYVVEIRSDVLAEIDGPMLKYGLQASHGERLLVPKSTAEQPDPERLEIRYDEFRRAS